MSLSLHQDLLAQRSVGWPQVIGYVTSSKLSHRISHSPGGNYDAADVTYSYVVNGRRFSSQRISAIQYITRNKEENQRVLARFPAGATVAVYYDPKDPGYAVLIPGPSKSMLAALLGSTTGILLLVASITAIVAILRNRTRFGTPPKV